MEASKIQVVPANESESFYSNEDEDTLFLDVSAEELEEFEREEMALNTPGDPTLEDIVKWCDELLNYEEKMQGLQELYKEAHREESRSKRKREKDEDELNVAQKSKCDVNEDITDLLCITTDKLFKIEDYELQLRRFVLLSNLEQNIEQALLL